MQVDGNIAKTKVVQTFTNHGDISIPEACYSFPLYDGATVTAFRCEVGDDKVLEGVVKPKDEAKREFKRAVQKQEAAALVEEMAPDIFQTTIGNITPRTDVKVEITYVEELHTDLSGEGTVVTIPTSVAPRYGTPPTGYTTSLPIKETGLSLVVAVASPNPLGGIVCRSGHEISIEYGEVNHLPEATSFEILAQRQRQANFGSNPKHATARLSNNQTSMNGDFVLFIPYSDGVLKSRALLAPSSGSDHAAMMVTVRPSELFSDLQESMDEFDGEVIFLADRSSSMRGRKIEELKDALLVFLKSLPEKSQFNLYSFGSDVSSLWPHSRMYDEATMQEAIDHVSTFRADFGGTNVLKALKKAVGDHRSINVSSTQIILLTDGEIWQSKETIEFVRMTTSQTESRVRFFSLGIGNRVNHQLIQGIGFFGGGFGEAVAVDSDGKWNEAVIRMLKGAVMPNSWSYSISFGGNWKEQRLDVDSFPSRNLEAKTSGALVHTPGAVNPSFVQAPRRIPWLHHFGQQSVFFLLETTGERLPEHVVITACSQYGGTKTATLVVTQAPSSDTAIRHLAAKAAVRDLESQDTSEAPSKTIRENAERLSQMYSICSKWTSFVAVSHLQQSAEYEDVEVSLYRAPLAELDLLTRPGVSQAGANLVSPTALPTTEGPHTRRDGIGPIMQYSPRTQPPPSPERMASLKPRFDDLADRFYSSSERSSDCRVRPPITKRGPYREQTKRKRDDVPDLSIDSASVHTTPVCDVGPTSQNGPVDDARAIHWQEVIRCQRADGLFNLGKRLRYRMARHFCHGTRRALKSWLLERVESPGADDAEESGDVWLLVDTTIAIAYVRSHFYSQQGLLDLLVRKAEGRLTSYLNSGEWGQPDELSSMADSALAHAHYGRFSQGSGEGLGWIRNASIGRCGVCNPQSEEWRSSVMHDDDFRKCSVSGCDVSVSKWDEFWAHAVEQGHIYSSCEAARSRYDEATAKDKGGNSSRDVQKAERKVVQEDPKDQQGQNQSATLKRKRDVADVV
ncbi:hypothetical protein SLS64_013052 [Diaporthe eres]|uniref:von Willebrand domain-containing protein n=1 Tax=Diaporthe eres TaxID=83184 RepID=A0ABR1P5W5_DIAER